MTIDEFAKFADAIKTYFPRDNVLPTNKSMDLWFDMLKDLDYEIAHASLKKYVSLNRFPPTISDIREQYNEFIYPIELNEMEAWSLVSKAIRNGGYNSSEEFSKLPPIVQKAVGSSNQIRIWALDENYNESVIMSNFQRSYKIELEREKEIQKIPINIRKLIDMTNIDSHSYKIENKSDETFHKTDNRKQKEG